MPLHWLIICDVCGTRTEYEKSEDVPGYTPFHNHNFLCEECSAVLDEAHRIHDFQLTNVIRQLRGLDK